MCEVHSLSSSSSIYGSMKGILCLVPHILLPSRALSLISSSMLKHPLEYIATDLNSKRTATAYSMAFTNLHTTLDVVSGMETSSSTSPFLLS